MERYTYFDGGKWRLKIGDTEYSGDWVDRLAAYEDTGLKPEDMKRAFNEDAVLKLAGQALGMSPDRLRELAYAEKDGRLVVLPRLHGKKVEVFSIREAAEAALDAMGGRKQCLKYARCRLKRQTLLWSSIIGIISRLSAISSPSPAQTGRILSV